MVAACVCGAAPLGRRGRNQGSTNVVRLERLFVVHVAVVLGLLRTVRDPAKHSADPQKGREASKQLQQELDDLGGRLGRRQLVKTINLALLFSLLLGHTLRNRSGRPREMFNSG